MSSARLVWQNPDPPDSIRPVSVWCSWTCSVRNGSVCPQGTGLWRDVPMAEVTSPQNGAWAVVARESPPAGSSGYIWPPANACILEDITFPWPGCFSTFSLQDIWSREPMLRQVKPSRTNGECLKMEVQARTTHHASPISTTQPLMPSRTPILAWWGLCWSVGRTCWMRTGRRCSAGQMDPKEQGSGLGGGGLMGQFSQLRLKRLKKCHSSD